MTLGNAAAAKVRLIACKSCGYRAEPDVDALAAALGTEFSCSRMGIRTFI